MIRGRWSGVIDLRLPYGLLETVPWKDAITAYDRAHLTLYLKLLDAVRAGVLRDQISSDVMRLGASIDPEVARRVVDSHIDRAVWMSRHGYRHLLAS